MYFMTLSRLFFYIPTIKKQTNKQTKVINQSLQLFYVLVSFFFGVNYYCFLITPSVIVYER